VPTSGFPTAPIGLTLTGEGFDTGIQVTLLKSGESTIACTSETITITLVELTTTCDITGVAEGFWDVRATNTGGGIATLVNGLSVNATITLQAVGVDDGEHRIRIVFDDDDVFLYLDEVLTATHNNGMAINYNDNSNDWEMFTNNAMPAVEYAKIIDGSNPMLWYEIMTLPELNLIDVSGEGNTIIARYPDTPAGLTTQIQPLEATGVVVDPAGSGSEIVGEIGALSNADPTEFSNVPVFNGLFDIPKVLLYHLATVSDVPYNVVLILAGFMITVAFGLAAAVFRQSFMIYAAMIMGSTFSIFYGDGIWGWIVPITFGVMMSPILVKYLRA
jgi:hypothetical protein